MTPELTKFIREEIRRQINIILYGQTGTTEYNSEIIENLYPGMPSTDPRPVAHPFGLVSRAPKGTLNVSGRIGDHPAQRVVIGHQDKNRPNDLNEGETYLYSKDGYQVRVKNGKIEVGKDGDYETLMLGDTTNAVLVALLQEAINHVHTGNLGAPTTPSLTGSANLASDLTDIQADKNLCKDNGAF